MGGGEGVENLDGRGITIVLSKLMINLINRQEKGKLADYNFQRNTIGKAVWEQRGEKYIHRRLKRDARRREKH